MPRAREGQGQTERLRGRSGARSEQWEKVGESGPAHGGRAPAPLPAPRCPAWLLETRPRHEEGANKP
eukprot:4442130-Pyramimonas_sp.AAC.1